MKSVNKMEQKKVKVKAVRVEDKEEKHFTSLWQAGKYIREERLKERPNVTIDHYCNNIKTNARGKTKSAYGYKWEIEE